MACREETREIGGRKYFCIQWAAETALLNKMKLAKIFGAVFAEIAILISEGSGDIESNIGRALKDSDPKEVIGVMKEVVESAFCDGKRIDAANFNEIFSGDNLIYFYQVFGFVLELNYKSFFGGKLAGVLSKIQGTTQASET